MTRRQLLSGIAGTSLFTKSSFKLWEKLDPAQEASPQNEEFWLKLREGFTLPTDFLCLNQVGLTATPNQVREAEFKQNTRATTAPSYIVYRKQRHEIDRVRLRLAKFLGAKEEEVALTQNGTAGLHTTIMGWPLSEGHAIISTNHDYSRAWNAIHQRQARYGTPVITVEIPPEPIPDDQYLSLWEEKLHDKVGLALVCSMTYLTGHVVPYQKVIQLCHERGIPVLVDAAQSIALRPIDFTKDKSDFLTACLHKWVMAPVGTGVFVVKDRHIKDLWALHPPAQEISHLITKFEQVGTMPYAAVLATDTALDLHEWIGMQRISDRLFELRKRIFNELSGDPAVTLLSTLDRSRHDGMVTLQVKGKPGNLLASDLMSKHAIHVTTVNTTGIDGIRVSPHIYTTVAEVDRLISALRILMSNP